MWLARVELAEWGALATGVSAVLGAMVALWRQRQSTPNRVMLLVEQLQEEQDSQRKENQRLRAQITALEEELAATRRQHREEIRELQRDFLAQISGLRLPSRAPSRSTRGRRGS